MKKGKILIVLGFVFLVCILFYMTFISKNPYLNELLFFVGGIVTICLLAYGCDEIEKNNKKHKIKTKQ